MEALSFDRRRSDAFCPQSGTEAALPDSRPPAAAAATKTNDAAAPPSPSPAVAALVAAVAGPRATSLPLRPDGGAPGATNAVRTAERKEVGGYAAAGTTQQGDHFAGVAALKLRDPSSGVEAEVFTASAQVGAQSELQAGLARVGMTANIRGVDVAASVDTFTLRANAGVQNDDASLGANLGVMATGAGVEATFAKGGWSLTLGLSVSAGAAVSSGERNADGDKVPERCFKASIGPATIGVCTEL